MSTDVQIAALPFRSLDDIRDHVRHVLCSHDRLDVRQAELRQARITRAGEECGLMFQIRGPRLLRSYAVWAGAEHRILFYDSTGKRFAETKVAQDPTAIAALKAAA